MSHEPQMTLTNQRGVVLIISLVVLLILTILGSTALKSTIVQEKMAGFARNKQISLDSSEAGLRVGENAADQISIAAPTDGTDGLWEPNPTNPVWLDATKLFSWITLPAASVTGVIEQPRYILENTGTIPRDTNCALDAEASLNQDCWRYTYRITSHGGGKNAVTTSTVQSTILSRK